MMMVQRILCIHQETKTKKSCFVQKPHSVIWNHVWSQKVFKHLTYLIKLIWIKRMSINDIFVGQQICKQAHTHAKLYRTCATVHLFKAQIDYLSHCTALSLTKPVIDCRSSSSFSNILLNFMSAFCHVASHGHTQKYVNN